MRLALLWFCVVALQGDSTEVPESLSTLAVPRFGFCIGQIGGRCGGGH